jgi:hypothetical protein
METKTGIDKQTEMLTKNTDEQNSLKITRNLTNKQTYNFKIQFRTKQWNEKDVNLEKWKNGKIKN